MFSFDPHRREWEEDDSLQSPRAHLATVECDGTLFAIGGAFATPDRAGRRDARAAPYVEGRQALTVPRSYPAVAVLDGRMHVIGGECRALGLLTQRPVRTR